MLQNYIGKQMHFIACNAQTDMIQKVTAIFQGYQLLGITWREKHRAQSERTHEPGTQVGYRQP